MEILKIISLSQIIFLHLNCDIWRSHSKVWYVLVIHLNNSVCTFGWAVILGISWGAWVGTSDNATIQNYEKCSPHRVKREFRATPHLAVLWQATDLRASEQCQIVAVVSNFWGSVQFLRQCQIVAAVSDCCGSVRLLWQCQIVAAVSNFCGSVRLLRQCPIF